MTYDDRLHVTWQVDSTYPPGASEHMREQGRRKFAAMLLEWLEANGGGIVGPLHEDERTENDWLFGSGRYRVFSMTCNVSALPTVPEFKMLGGPHDGRIFQTGGISPWRVPMPPPAPTVLRYGEEPSAASMVYAEYERVAGTQGYRFSGLRR